MITVRDGKSLEELEQISVRKRFINCRPRLRLQDAVGRIPGKFAAWRDAHASKRSVIAVSVRSIPTGTGIDTRDFICPMARTCDILMTEFDHSILFIPQCIYDHGNRNEDDRNIAGEIIKLASSRENIFAVNDDIDVTDCASLYEGAVAALCTRLHGNVFAAMQKVPVIGINYNPKVYEFHKWLGTEDAVVEKWIISIRGHWLIESFVA